MLTIQQLTKRFSAVTSVNALDLQINEGEWFMLLGPSGRNDYSGKVYGIQ